MSGTSLPLFLHGQEVPKGYFESPDPYAPVCDEKYHIRAMIDYAKARGKSVPELTKDEIDMFLINPL